jgi:hypothetical protein
VAAEAGHEVERWWKQGRWRGRLRWRRKGKGWISSVGADGGGRGDEIQRGERGFILFSLTCGSSTTEAVGRPHTADEGDDHTLEESHSGASTKSTKKLVL